MGKSEQGASPNRYCIIPRVLIFAQENGKVLLIKGAANKKIWPGQWNGIGGHVEMGETLIQAAQRELFEETGLRCEDLQFCGQVIVDLGKSPGIGIHVFKTIHAEGNLRKSLEGEVDWVNFANVFDLPLVKDLFILLPKVLEFHKGDAPFFGVYSYNANDELVISFD